jgi:hypothetical protein
LSKEHAEGGKSCKFALPYSLEMNVCERSVSGFSRFICDVSCTEVLVSLDISGVLIINYWKMVQNYNIEIERIREENCLTGSKALNNITIL